MKKSKKKKKNRKETVKRSKKSQKEKKKQRKNVQKKKNEKNERMRKVGVQTQKKWGPRGQVPGEGGRPGGWGPEGVGSRGWGPRVGVNSPPPPSPSPPPLSPPSSSPRPPKPKLIGGILGSQWIWPLREPIEQCGTSALKTTQLNFEDCKNENSQSFLREVRQATTSLLGWAYVWNLKKSTRWEQRDLSHNSEHVCKLTCCRWGCRSISFMDITRIPRAAECLWLNPSPTTQEPTACLVRCIAGTWRLGDQTTKRNSCGNRWHGHEFQGYWWCSSWRRTMEARPQTHPHDRKVRGSVRVSCVAYGRNVECHQTTDDLGWCDQSRETALCKSSARWRWQSHKASRNNVTWIDPKLLNDWWREEMECMRKHEVFEVVDENATIAFAIPSCCSGWTRLKVTCAVRNWSVGKSRGQEQRWTAWTRRCFFTHATVGRVEDAGVMTGHDDANRADGTIAETTWDVSRAHLYGDARRWICTYLPEGYEHKSALARLCLSMYGTWDATSNLGRHDVVRSVEGWFHESWHCVPCLLLQ